MKQLLLVDKKRVSALNVRLFFFFTFYDSRGGLRANIVRKNN